LSGCSYIRRHGVCCAACKLLLVLLAAGVALLLLLLLYCCCSLLLAPPTLPIAGSSGHRAPTTATYPRRRSRVISRMSSAELLRQPASVLSRRAQPALSP